MFDSLRFHFKKDNVFVYFLPQKVVFITQEVNYSDNDLSLAATSRGDENLAKKLSAVTTAHRFELVFEGCNQDVAVDGVQPSQVRSDYYLGHCPSGILNVPVFNTIRYKNLYPGIDLSFTYDGKQLKYYFNVSPGADPDNIRLRWDGVESLEKNNLQEIHFTVGSFHFNDMAPVSSCGGQSVATEYQTDGNTVKFQLGSYNVNDSLIIDPGLYWASSLQYNGYGTWGGLVTTTAGEYYVVDWEWNPGLADVSTYLSSAGTSTLYSSDAACDDIIISRFRKNGALLWVCRYGGTGDDDVNGGVELDGNNNLFIAGTSVKEFSAGSGDFPLQTWAGAFNQAWDGSLSTGSRGYLLKFLPDNSRQWATYLDRGAYLEVFDIACGLSNSIYLTGTSGGSPTNITTGSIPSGTGYLGALNGTSTSHSFIMEFNSSGALYWATWLPGVAASTGTGRCSDIAVNKTSGAFFVGGDDMWSSTTPFNTAIISATYTNKGNSDIFYLAFNSSNQPIPANGKYFGGAGFDKINIGAMNGDMEVDASGNLYMCGHTYSANFPLVNPGTCAYYDGVINDGTGITANVAATQDGYLVKANSSGTMVLSTFFGGTGSTSMKMLKKDSHNNLWICGMQSSTGLAQVSRTGYFNQAFAGTNQNLFMAQLGTNDNMEWLAYYGFSTGYSDYNGFDIFEPTTDSVYTYLAGNFNYTVNTGGGYQYSSSTSCSGAAQFRNYYTPYSPFTISGATSLCQGNSTTWTATTGGGTWSSSNSGVFSVNSSTGAVLGVSAGTATITYTLTISSCTYTASANIIVTAGTTPTFSTYGPYCIGATPAALPATSTNGIAGTWSPATISTAAAGTSTYTFTPSVACATTTTLSVTVNAQGTATISASGPTTFCPGGSVILTAGGGTTYQWSTGATTSSITVTASGNYTVSITSGCGSPPSIPVSVTLNAPPVAIITGDNSLCAGETSVLSAASSIAGNGTITGYQWWYDNGTTNTAISGATGVTYTASQAGTYSCVITDSNGCSSVACP
ncbi:hypothetical protein DSECCO2_519990 [anaerobic digester metagenome]